MGENVYYSGTVGAAMEGAINRVPAIAVSVSYKSKELDYRPAANFTRILVPLILAEGLPPGILLNVNAVSYTHLDVYKRQSTNWVTKFSPSLPSTVSVSTPCSISSPKISPAGKWS